MADLLLELFSEEIPAGMQARGAQDLQRLVCDGLKAAGLDFAEAENFAGPRRLTLAVKGLPEKSPDISEERKGPRIGSPDKAVEGFLRGAGLSSIDEAEIVSDEKKGDFYVARISKPGRATAEVIAELVPSVIRSFPWPKSQRWGAGRLRWVRPLHSVLCLLGGKSVPFEVDGIASGDTTFGHRFMAPKAIQISGFDDYAGKLREHFVVLEASERQKIILEGAKAVAEKAGLELVEDDALLVEAAGLVEWPVVLMGAFDKDFLDVPPEVIQTAIRKHQKCFSVRDPKSGKLASNFILVSNLKAEDGGKAIVAGNERVVRARLSDAKFFWDQDRKVKLEDRLPALKDIIFHEKLGTQAERVERLKALARELAPIVGADPDKAERAAALAKADLVTGMVGEFPDLQGLMGKYYALDQGEDVSVALAIEQHYKPVGQSDSVPADPVSIAVALADKLDTLVGFWAIDEKPTGSKDPYALRRAALGVIRVVLERGSKIQSYPILYTHFIRMVLHRHDAGRELMEKFHRLLQDTVADPQGQLKLMREYNDEIRPTLKKPIRIDDALPDLLAFFHDRLKVYLRDRGARHDLIDAVISPGSDDLLMIVARVEALGKFLETDDGANLLAGVKRAQNILRIEEKKDKRSFDDAPDKSLLKDDEEKALAEAIDQASKAATAAVEQEDFAGAMSAIAKLRAPVDAFFDAVTVNADDPKLRENRLKLLNRIRESTLSVADFSKISG